MIDINTMRDAYEHWTAVGASDEKQAEARRKFDAILAAHDAKKRAEWEAEQGWEYAIGAQSEDRPGKFWRDSDWDTTTELHEALGDLEDALPVFSNAVVIRRRPSTPWLPVPDTTNNESEGKA